MQFVFGDYALDVSRRELRRGSGLVAIEPQVFDLLVYLLQNRDRVVSKDDLLEAVWGGRIVSESTLTSRINAARRAIGDSGEQQALIRTIARKGIRFVGEVGEPKTTSATANRARQPSEPLRQDLRQDLRRDLRRDLRQDLRQDIHFCTAPDGTRIAYAEVGSGLPLVKTANWLSHLEYDWQSPVWKHLLHALAANHRLIRYDARGNGLSDWEVNEISLEAFVHDLESVVEATGLQRFDLLGMSQGCAVSIAYAVRHPERVRHLVLYGGFARGKRRRGSSRDMEQSDALLTLMRQGWGQENPAFRQIFTSLFFPGGTAEQMRWFNDLQRITTSPENAVRIRQAVDDIDVSELLPQVKAPALVLHCRNDAVHPFDEGRRLAAGIPGARFVALEGSNHVILESDPAWPRFIEEISNFLRS